MIDIEDVVGDLNTHQSFRLPSLAPGVELTDLPNFDDVTQHDVSETAQHDLWELEAERLVEAVTQMDSLRFEGSPDLASNSKYGYAILADLADRMWQSLSVATYDREDLLRRHKASLCNFERLHTSGDILKRLVSKEDDEDGGGKRMDDPPAAKGSHEDFFALVDYCTAVLARYLCFAVDGYSVHINIIAHMAKLSTKIKVVSADLSNSAQRSLRPKTRKPTRRVPAYIDPDTDSSTAPQEGSALSSTESSEECNDGAGSESSKEQGLDTDIIPAKDYSEHYTTVTRYHKVSQTQAPVVNSGKLSSSEATSKKGRLRILYFEKCRNYHRSLVELLEGVLSHFRGTKLTQAFSTSYEVCSMVYETGFERFRTLVFQDGEQNFSGTSDTNIVNYAGNAFYLLDQAFHHVRYNADRAQANRPTTGSQHGSDRESVGTMISWKYAVEASEDVPDSSHGQTPTRLELKSMSNVITLLVPLLLSEPSIVVNVSAFFGCIAYNKYMRQHSLPTNRAQTTSFSLVVYPQYTGHCSVSTSDHRSRQDLILSHDGPRSLSNALMRNNYLYSGHPTSPYRVETTNLATGPNGKTTGSATPEPNVLDQIQSRREELDCLGERMESWIYEEGGVMVKCKTYVASTMLSALLLAASGLAVGVTLGPRISAVDPFNLTTYCWALAAFVILVAKSVRVREWSWHDFLHCQVLCRSVSELASVTGIDEQLILAKLVQVERNSILETRGPFNKVFDGNKSADGFSIDRPIGMWAMLLSGLIMIEVESLDGRRLVCLDLRRGTKLGTVENQTKVYFQCLYSKQGEIPASTERTERREVLEEEGTNMKSQVQLKRGELTWTRALGLYSNKDAFFV